MASVSPRLARYSHTDTFTQDGRVISVISVASLSDRSLSYDFTSSDTPITGATSAKFALGVSSVKVRRVDSCVMILTSPWKRYSLPLPKTNNENPLKIHNLPKTLEKVPLKKERYL